MSKCDDDNRSAWTWAISMAVVVWIAFLALCTAALVYFKARWHLGLVLASVLVAGVFVAGCRSPAVKTSVAGWRTDWNAYRAATVASPAYVDSGAAVAALGKALDDDLTAVEAAVK
jgi:hypothetical protein